jgi:hypothetical protein
MRTYIILALDLTGASVTTLARAAEGQEPRGRPNARWVAFDVNGDGRLDAEERQAWWAERQRRAQEVEAERKNRQNPLPKDAKALEKIKEQRIQRALGGTCPTRP